MRSVPATLVIDFGTTSAAAMVVSDQGSWLVPDPASGEARWRCAIHWDGQHIVAGTAAEERRRTDPSGYAAEMKRGLELDTPVMVGARHLRPVEQTAELFAAMRAQAQRHVGPVNRAVVTIPASMPPGDPRRGRVVAAAEAAGFGAVELLVESAGALWAPGSPAQVGEVVLVYDLGTTFEVAVVRVGDDLPEEIGQASIVDWPAEIAAAEALELTLACCRDLLARLNLNDQAVRWVLPVGGGVRTPGLDAALERGLGVAVALVDEPELAVVRGAAHWLPRSGPRTVMARPAVDRMTPLVFTIPGGSARLLRWLVHPEQSYAAGTPLARVRLAGGTLWDLTARSRGTLDQVLVDGGSPVSSGEWLALARHG